MKYIITGGAGFIGSNLARELIRRRQKVKIIDNLSAGNLQKIADFKNRVEFVKGDIRNLNLLKKEFNGYDYVLHHAALRAVAKSVDNPIECNDNNITGTLNVLAAAKDARIKRVVFASSSAVYGDGLMSLKHKNIKTLKQINRQTLNQDNNLTIKQFNNNKSKNNVFFLNQQNTKNSEKLQPNPLSPYALSKLTGEWYCRIFWELYGLPTVCLRYFNVYGQWQNPESKYSAVIPIFVKQILNNQSPTIYGSGNQSRDFVYIDDVVQANFLALKAPKIANGQTFNIGSGEKPTSVNDLFKKLQNILNKQAIKPKYAPPQTGDVFKTEADISLAKKILEYKPQIKIEDGLRKYAEWCKTASSKL